MRKVIKAALASALLFSTLTAQTLPVMACAFASENYFTFTTHPDLPMKSYAEGKLGILQNTYARSYLLVAYKYLSDAPLSAEEQKEVVSLWYDRLSQGDFTGTTDPSSWIKARSAVPGIAKAADIYPDRSISKEESWTMFCNCQPSAFQTAIKTLQNLVTKYGASAQGVKDWVAAQDKVFSNCGNAPYSDKMPAAAIPEPLPATADAALRQDRAYQIAAANFYAQNYDAAAKEFQAIAADAASPWNHVAGYLAVRSVIRHATLGKTVNKSMLEQASEMLKKIIVDPKLSDLSSDMKELQSYIAVRLTPEQHLQELAKEKISKTNIAEFTKTIDVLLGGDDGGQEVKYASLPASLKQPELIDWIMCFQANDDEAKHHAVDKWKQTKSLPWLVAAIASIDEKDPNANAILAEAAKHENSPAKWTLLYHANRIGMAQGKGAKVRADLDKLLANPPADIPLGTLNKFKTQRLVLAQNLGDIAKFGVQTPLSNCSNGGTEQVPDDMDEIVKSGKIKKEDPLFTTATGNMLISKLPMSALKQLSSNTSIPAPLRNNLAWTSWVRAVLLGDDNTAKDLAPIVKALNKAKTKYVDAYLAAATPEDKKFSAVNLMLHFSSAQPTASSGSEPEDAFGDASGWWWGAPPINEASNSDSEDSSADDTNIEPAFLTAAQKAELKAQLGKLSKVEAAPNYFAKVVLPFAKAHPTDARVPEALHFLVSATHYGSTDDATKAFSKQAFSILHTKYKTDPWTKKTPYFY